MIAASPALPATAYIAGFFAAERLRGRERGAVIGAGKALACWPGSNERQLSDHRAQGSQVARPRAETSNRSGPLGRRLQQPEPNQRNDGSFSERLFLQFPIGRISRHPAVPRPAVAVAQSVRAPLPSMNRQMVQNALCSRGASRIPSPPLPRPARSVGPLERLDCAGPRHRGRLRSVGWN
jgi:hypothetical protein